MEVMTVRRNCLLVFSLGLAFGGLAQTQATPVVRDHDIEAEDYFRIGVILTCEASPDGKYIAYTESRWGTGKEKRNTDLWVVDTKTRERRRLTFDKASDRSPAWSADSKYIYFTSGRKAGDESDPPYDGKTQVWRISPEGGPITTVTRVKDGINEFDLSNDGRTLYYSVDNEETEEEWKDLRKKYKDLEYGHGVTDFTQVWKLDLESWYSEKLVDENRVIRSFSVSPDESRIAMLEESLTGLEEASSSFGRYKQVTSERLAQELELSLEVFTEISCSIKIPYSY